MIGCHRELRLLLLTIGVAPLWSSIILDYPDPGTPAGVAINATHWLQASWTVSRAYANVSIFVPLRSWTSGETFTVSAYLTGGTGPATPPPLAVTSYSNATNSGTWENVALFSHLTLHPGTYYLTLSSNDSNGEFPGALWKDWNVPAITDEGVSRNDWGLVQVGSIGTEDPAYPPASVFVFLGCGCIAPLLYTVTGDPVPEPSPFALLGAPILLAAIGVIRNARRHGIKREQRFSKHAVL